MSASKTCPQCDAEYALDQRFCPLDGSTLKTEGAASDLVGSVIADRYYVLRKLGEGGMGQVYLAEHVRMGRKSALKVMHPGTVHNADAISRFNREASNASRISHPNVAAIYDFGETADGLIYLAMEFVEGEALTEIVQRGGALPPARAADIVQQASGALASAHDMGIVHRDLKPDNIMITKNRDGSDCVKVVDFGIAKSNEGSQKVTKTGLVVGTPEYMSPEQLAGDKLDGRSDTYSLGLVAFHMLTGLLPFPSESAQESMIMRLTDRPKRLGELRADVAWPPELQAAMDRALERDARLRYASAADFGRDFARAVEGMPETAVSDAGTVVMDAAGTVPPTWVAGATAAVASPMGARAITGRTPMLAAAAVLAVLAVGAVTMNVFDGPPAADARTDSLPPAATLAEKTDLAPSAAAPDAPAPTGELGGQVEKAAADPGVMSPEGAVATMSPRDTMRRVETINADAATAREAIRSLNRIASLLVKGSEDHAWAQLLRAEAHAALDQERQMCVVLGTIQGTSDNATRAARIATMRAACP